MNKYLVTFSEQPDTAFDIEQQFTGKKSNGSGGPAPGTLRQKQRSSKTKKFYLAKILIM